MMEIYDAIRPLFDRAKHDGVELYVYQDVEENTYKIVIKKDDFSISEKIAMIDMCDAFVSPVVILNYRYDRCLEKLQETINKSRGE